VLSPAVGRDYGEFVRDGWRLVLAAFMLLWVTNGLALAGLTIFDPTLLALLEISRGELKLRDLITFLMAGLAGPLAGIAVARFGPRRVVLAGLLLLSVALLGYTSLASLWQLYALHAVIGIGLAAAGLVPNVAAISSRFSASRGLALGIALAGTSLGGIAFPQLNSVLLQALGWRPAFAVLAALTVLLMLAALRIPDRPLATASRTSRPLLTGSAALFSQPRFWALCIVAFASFYSVTSVATHLALYASDRGWSIQVAANLLTLLFASTLLAKVAAGWLGDRFGPVHTLPLMVAGMLAGSLLLNLATPQAAMIALVLFGLGWGGVYTLLQAVAASLFPAGVLSRALGWIVLFDAVGGGLGPWVTGLQFDASGSYGGAMITLTVLLAVALATASGLALSGAIRPQSPEPSR